MWICTVFQVYRLYGEAWQIEVVQPSGALRCNRRNRKTWRECVKDDMEVLGLLPEWAVFKDVWRDFIWANV